MAVPNPVYIFRMMHIDNLDHVCSEGKLCCPNHAHCDPNYTAIGDGTLIGTRDAKEIPIEPGGTFRDYVSFYFGPRSPMLYRIKTGYEVKKRPQSDIIYLVSTVQRVVDAGKKFIFTDGQANHQLSFPPFNDLKDLDQVDWKAVYSEDWRDSEQDPDIKRRKQAEFLVYKEVPLELIAGIVVYNKESANLAQEILDKHNLKIPVTVAETRSFKTVGRFYYS